MYMTYKQLEQEQKQPLDYKIARAVESIGAALAVCKHRAAIAFSGGKDSTVLWHLIRTYFPEWTDRIYIIFGNTGVEYPESLAFARKLGAEWGGKMFHETRPLKTEREGLKYAAQCRVLEWVIDSGRLSEILKPDGKLKRTTILEEICPAEMMKEFREERLVWRRGTEKSYFWCVDQYGYPLLGKAFSKLKAHRINIDCFLRFSDSKSVDPKTLAYYDILRDVKISQACCDILKKEPSERLQVELDVDVIFKGLMAAESRTRETNFLSRGYLFQSSRPHCEPDPFYHCNPISIWSDEDIWAYTRLFDVPYSPLYDMGWTDNQGVFHGIERNGCMACGTDLLYENNHMAMLRHTHPPAWDTFMRKGMAEEIRNLQCAKRNGQLSVLDVMDLDEIMRRRPCAFDRIDRLVLAEVAKDTDMTDYDPDGDVDLSALEDDET